MLVSQNNGIMPSERNHVKGFKEPLSQSVACGNPYIRKASAVPTAPFYIRYTDAHGRSCGFTEDETNKKILICGGSGFGKSNAFYQSFSEVVSKPGNKVNLIFDSKGDFYLRYKIEDAKREAVVSHRHGYATGVQWNVFSEILSTPKEDRALAVRETAKMLLGNKTSQGARQQFFVDAAVELLSVAMQVLLSEYYATFDMPTNADLVRFISLLPEEILSRADEYGLRDRIDMLILEKQDGAYNGQTQGVIAEVKNAINDLFIGRFGSENGDFSIRREIQNCNGVKNIFIEYDVNYGAALSPIYSCLIQNAIKETLGRGRRNCKVNLFIDEWPLLCKIPDMEAAISFGREQGLFIAAAFQHIGQMKAIYGEQIAEGMLNGFHNIIAFNSFDPATRDYVRRRIGTHFQEKEHYFSLSDRATAYTDDLIIRDEDITTLDIGEALVIPGSSKTITRFRFRNVKDERK